MDCEFRQLKSYVQPYRNTLLLLRAKKKLFSTIS